jgi:hypothetical protein
MVFVPEFAPDAESQWHDLPPILQELVWDEIERLVHAPPPGKEEFIHDFVHEDAEAWHYIPQHQCRQDCRPRHHRWRELFRSAEEIGEPTAPAMSAAGPCQTYLNRILGLKQAADERRHFVFGDLSLCYPEYKLLSLVKGKIHLAAIERQKDVGSASADPFVAVDKPVVAGQMIQVRTCHRRKVSVEELASKCLTRSRDRGLNEGDVANSILPAEVLQRLGVELEHFVKG